MPDKRTARTRILIVDDHPLFRDGLRRLIETEPHLEIVGEPGDGATALDQARAFAPDLMLLDMSMPGTSGIDVMRQMAVAAPQTRVLLLTAGIDSAELREALRFGARGLVLKTAGSAIILKAIRAVAAGEHWVGRDVVNELAQAVADLREGRSGGGDHRRLTPREREVLRSAVEGLANKDIAVRLSISEHTVKHHLTKIFEKTGQSSRVELVVYAIQHGLAAPTRPMAP